MPRQPRHLVVDHEQVQIFHATQRCVRQAYLCGRDRVSGESFDHRRGWIRERMELLSSIFGIDCLTYTVLSNHLHVVLRTRPDVVNEWSDQDVARRWLKLFPIRKKEDGSAEEPTSSELEQITSQPDMLAERRRRLLDISWWMRCLAENIARRANKEDDRKGRFWEGRFRLQSILDEAGLLACSAYVDLNPIRASIANTPESSDYTGAKDRIDDLQESDVRPQPSAHAWERSPQRQRSGWMSPIEIDSRNDTPGPSLDDSGRRASAKGFLCISMPHYIQLLDWTGRQLRDNKAGAIPGHLAPILARLGIDGPHLVRRRASIRSCFQKSCGNS
ncbi:MAG: hypothetical protein AAF989_13120 [Planctomycetota bacterium]